MESIINGTAIAVDKPFVVGDYIKIGNYEGTVIEVKFRCTRIRTPDDSVVTIQNSTIANSEIVNHSKRTRRREDIILNLQLEINSTVLERIQERLKDVLETDEEVIKGSVRTFIEKIDTDGIKLKIYLYTNILDYDEFLQFKTKINLLAIKVLETEGVKISYPGKKIYMS